MRYREFANLFARATGLQFPSASASNNCAAIHRPTCRNYEQRLHVTSRLPSAQSRSGASCISARTRAICGDRKAEDQSSRWGEADSTHSRMKKRNSDESKLRTNTSLPKFGVSTSTRSMRNISLSAEQPGSVPAQSDTARGNARRAGRVRCGSTSNSPQINVTAFGPGSAIPLCPARNVSSDAAVP